MLPPVFGKVSKIYIFFVLSLAPKLLKIKKFFSPDNLRPTIATIDNFILQIKLILCIIFIFYKIWDANYSLLGLLKGWNASLAYTDVSTVFKSLPKPMLKSKDKNLTLLERYVSLMCCRMITRNSVNRSGRA